MIVILLIAGVLLILIGMLFAVSRRYRRCPSDRILVVYGKVGGGKSAKCIHGGATFVWPLIQNHAYLELTPMPIEIPLKGALSRQNIRVNTPSTFTVGIATEPGVMENAAERLLGLSQESIRDLAKDIIFGQMRVVIATMSIEEINSDRDKLISNIASGVEVELKKVGLRLINVNIQDVTDESGYIEALGKEAASKAINEAKVKVAQAERDGEIGAAQAGREREVEVANAQAEATKGKNLAQIEIANSNAALNVEIAEANRLAVTAERVATANAERDSYTAQQEAESARAQVEQATRYANEVVPAEVQKKRITVLAEAEADQVRIAANAQADSIRATADAAAFEIASRLGAEAEGTKQILHAKADGFRQMIESAGNNPQIAITLLLSEQMPKLVEAQAEAISGIKIDKVTVWDNGGGENGTGSTANFLSGMIRSLPPLQELARQAGLKLPDYLGEMEASEGRPAADGNGKPPADGQDWRFVGKKPE
ncbi:MAG TPA: SPFH domain-containing protein [Chthoniobacteraceae bacterium]|nr:SPFH domain-containing protein [Chthoniobacteraceae bacterium]